MNQSKLSVNSGWWTNAELPLPVTGCAVVSRWVDGRGGRKGDVQLTTVLSLVEGVLSVRVTKRCVSRCDARQGRG